MSLPHIEISQIQLGSVTDPSPVVSSDAWGRSPDVCHQTHQVEGHEHGGTGMDHEHPLPTVGDFAHSNRPQYYRAPARWPTQQTYTRVTNCRKASVHWRDLPSDDRDERLSRQVRPCQCWTWHRPKADEWAGEGAVAVPTGPAAVGTASGRSGQGQDEAQRRGLLFGWHDTPIVESPCRARHRKPNPHGEPPSGLGSNYQHRISGTSHQGRRHTAHHPS